MPISVELPRLRGTVAGAVSGVTAIGAHAQGHGELPGTPVLLVVAAVSTALGLAVARPSGHRTRSTLSLLPAMAAGQLLIHLTLIALTGAHHQLLTGPMAAVHTVATLFAVALVVAGEQLIGAVAALARRMAALVVARPYPPPERPPFPRAVPAPTTLLVLGTVGTRGPPRLA